MKQVKRFAAILLALTMVLAMGTTAFAAQRIENKTNHAYAAYQIFTGTQAEGEAEGKLAVTGWGSGINSVEFLAKLKSDAQFSSKFESASTAGEVSAVLADNPTLADAFAAAAHQYKSGSPIVIPAGTASAELAPGYYLLVDTTEVADKPDAKNVSLLQVTKSGAITIEKKYDVPTVQKKVKDINDTTDSNATDWQDSADYDIGDSIPFQLTGTLPAKHWNDYKTYYYQFNDSLSKGLTLKKESVKVYLVNDGQRTEIEAAKYSVSEPVAQGEDFSKFTVTFTDLKAVPNVKETSKIVVEYEAELNTNAVLGSKGNPNKVSLEFSNNPNFDGNGQKGKTAEDTVIVFTYQVVVNKVDQNEKPLNGAEFTLYKKLAGGSEKPIQAVKTSSADSAVQDVFTFKGLDDGSYVLRETHTPDGYNTISDIAFTVIAEHDIQSELPALNSLNGNITSGTVVTSSGQQENTLESDKGTGKLSAKIMNKQGKTLPGTGGIGTTVFYVSGLILIAAAVILLVSRKRMQLSKN